MDQNLILYENLPYGAYEFEASGEFTEALHYGSADFHKLYTQQIQLPNGRRNILYLLAKDFPSTMQLLQSSHFVRPSNWRRVFYPKWIRLTFMGRKIQKSISGQKTRNRDIQQQTKLIPYTAKALQKTNENVIFLGSDLYEAMLPILQKNTIKRNWTEFFPAYMGYLKNQTPVFEKPVTGKNSGIPILFIDTMSFGFQVGNQNLRDLKVNPLYLLYMAYFREGSLVSQKIDADILICANNMFLKMNPSRTTKKEWPIFRRALFQIIKLDLDELNGSLSEEEQKQLQDTVKDHTVSALVQDATKVYTKYVSNSTKTVLNDLVEDKLREQAAVTAKMDQEIKLSQGKDPMKGETDTDTFFRRDLTNPNVIQHPLSAKEVQFMQSLGSYHALTMEDEMEDEERSKDMEDMEDYPEFEDTVKDAATEILINDPEVASELMDEIQDKAIPTRGRTQTPANSARDKKLREAQKKVVVANSTIEEILQRDASNVPIEVDDKSAVLHTTNQNMYQVKFSNFDKTYIDHLMVRDLVACFDSLKDKDSPFFITGIEIRDSSNAMYYKETWTVHMTDETGKRHTIHVDIPKFQDNRFMYLNGTRFMILKQNFYNPLVKDTPDTVIMTTNFNKVTITRRATKSLASVERIFGLIKRVADQNVFMSGDSTKSNMKYISSLEYDELSQNLFRYSSNGCEIYFSRDYIMNNLRDRIPADIKANEFFIGTMDNGKTPILINEDTGLDRNGNTIIDLIEHTLPEAYLDVYQKIKPPKRSMYVEAKMAGAFLPVIAILVAWVGITETLERMGVSWSFHPEWKRMPQNTNTTHHIRFADGILAYEASTFADLIMNGISLMLPDKLAFSNFDREEGYQDFIYSIWGSYRGMEELENFKQFLMDPITKDVCRDMNLPQDAPGLLIHAVKLLCDNACVSKADDRSYRVRSLEMISGILYGQIAKQYKAYVKSGRKLPMTLNRNAVIAALLQEKTVEAYSTLNPAVEVSKTHTISTKGYKGSNSEHAYRDEQKRSYDPSAVGKLAISTSPKLHRASKTS